MPAFDTPTGLPLSHINLAQRKGYKTPDNNGLVSTAEVSTLQLEFRYLSYLTDNDAYWDAVEKVSEDFASIFTVPLVLTQSVGHAGYQILNDEHRISIHLHEVSATTLLRCGISHHGAAAALKMGVS